MNTTKLYCGSYLKFWCYFVVITLVSWGTKPTSVFTLLSCFSDKENCPKTIQDVKLINAGKILENNRTLGESRLPVGELPGGVITMHVVLRLPLSDKKNGK